MKPRPHAVGKGPGAAGAPRRSAGVPAVVWGVVALHGLLLVVMSVLYPTYRAPDEVAHVDMVLAVGQTSGYPEVGETRISRRVVESRAVVDHVQGEIVPLRAGDAPPRDARPTFAELGPDVASDMPQQMAAHPPLYYVAAATTLSAVTALLPPAFDWSFDQVVAFLRLFGAVLVLPLPLLAYHAAHRLDAGRSVEIVAAVVPLGIPQLTHVGASVSNDTLLVLLLTGLTLPALAVAQGDTTVRTALLTGLLGGLALLTKGFALFVPLWLGGVYALAAWRGGGWRALRLGAVAVMVATAVGGWWWLRNLATYGTVQPSGLASPPSPDGFTPDAGYWLSFYVRRLSQRFWIEPDIVPEGAPPVDLFATAALVALCAAAFVGYRRVRQRPADLAVLLAPLAGLGGIVTFGGWRVYARTGTPFAIHGRYVYGAVVGVAVLAALGAAALAHDRRRWLPLLALVVAAIAQLTAGWLALATYWGSSGLAARGAAVVAWSPWPATLVAAVVAAAAALALSLLGALLDEARAQGRSAQSR